MHPNSVVEWIPTTHPWSYSPLVNLEFREHPIADPQYPVDWDIFDPVVEEALVKLNMDDLAALRDAIQNAFAGTR